MKKLYFLMILFLSGCATTETVWVKPGSTEQDFYIDSSQCKAQGASIAGVSLYQLVFVYQNCMAGRGWYTQRVTKQ